MKTAKTSLNFPSNKQLSYTSSEFNADQKKVLPTENKNNSTSQTKKNKRNIIHKKILSY